MIVPDVGRHDARIVENAMREIGDKVAVALTCECPDSDPFEVLIWITDKSMGIARKQLHICGFDVDKENLFVLAGNPVRLEGKQIPILAEEYNGKIRCQIALNSEPSKKRMDQLTLALRAAKRNAEAPTQVPLASAQPQPVDDDIPTDLPF